MESIYWEKDWLKLQEEKEGGEGIEFYTKDKSVFYPFIKRKAGKIERN